MPIYEYICSDCCSTFELLRTLNQANEGAPVTQEFADSIGADGYAPDASSAVEKAIALVA